MDIEINEVHEIIKNLESGGEISIKEEKYLNVAKMCVQLAAENVALKSFIGECAGEGNWTSDVEKTVYVPTTEWMPPTPATDRIVAEAEARGVEKAIAHLEKKFSNIGVQIMNLQWLADSLREGGDK